MSTHWKPEEDSALITAAELHAFERGSVTCHKWEDVADALAQSGYSRSSSACSAHYKGLMDGKAAAAATPPKPAAVAAPGRGWSGAEEEKLRSTVAAHT